MSLIGSSSLVESAYEATLWAKVLHGFPHVNLSLHFVDSDFNPQNEIYLESLGILCSLPSLVLIAILFLLLIYLLTRCCDGKHRRRTSQKSRPIRCCLSFLSLLTLGVLGVSFWGNQAFHGGALRFLQASDNINSNLRNSKDLTSKYNSVLSGGIQGNLSHLYDIVFQRIGKPPEGLLSNSDFVFYNLSEALAAMDKIHFSIHGEDSKVDFNYVSSMVRNFERYRWPSTMSLQSLFSLFCLLLFVGAIIHSRCVLILFSVLGLFSIILLWLLTSVYLTSAVAIADFCTDPTPWLLHKIQETIPKSISTYYLTCSESNPFEISLATSQRSVVDIEKRIRQIVSTARLHYSPEDISPYIDDLESSAEKLVMLLRNIVASLKCDQIFRSYNTALVSLCDSGLFGLLLMLFSSVLSGFLFTILVWCNSHTWIYFKQRGRYIKVDDQDPYMPLSTIERSRGLGLPPSGLSSSGPYRRTLHTPPQTPPYHGTLNGHHSNVVPAYGQIGGHHTLAATGGPTSHLLGTLNRNTQNSSTYGHRTVDTLPSTMTLGRRGHYSSLRNNSRYISGGADHETGPAGPNSGQYATLSKQCKTLESSDFY